MADGNWYYTRSSTQYGPVALDALQTMARQGELQPQDMVWTEGMQNWVAAGSIASIFPQTIAGGAAAPINYAPAGANLSSSNLGTVNYYGMPNQVAYAGFWLRFCAAIVDGILLWIVGFLIRLPFFGLNGAFMAGSMRANATVNSASATANNRNIAPLLLIQATSIVIGWLYGALMESSRHQATLGKLAVGIKVTDLNGARIGFGQATGRHFAKIISGIILGIGYIMAGFTAQKQALHDMIASTLVIKKNQ